MNYCVICLEDIYNLEERHKKYFNCKCFDNFHHKCIYSWMTDHNKRCPLCRSELNYNIVFLPRYHSDRKYGNGIDNIYIGSVYTQYKLIVELLLNRHSLPISQVLWRINLCHVTQWIKKMLLQKVFSVFLPCSTTPY